MKFIKSASSTKDFIEDKTPEVCLIGRSNVGKSSLINALSNSSIARVSSTPGRTQLVNYFDFGQFRLVDLPGYGYAKLSKQKRDELVFLVESYLQNAKNLKAIFQICDSSVITSTDLEMSNYFKTLKIKHFIVLNKIDKQSNNYKNNLNKIIKYLGVNLEDIILVSATKNINIKKLNQLIFESSKL